MDLRPDCWDGIEREDLQRLGIAVPCVGITPAPLPPGLSLDTLATPDADSALPHLFASLERGASLGAKWAYMVTPNERVGEDPSYVRSMAQLGGHAASLGMKLCVEPSPGKALSDYTETIRLLDSAACEGLYALLDLGHLLLTGEDPAGTVHMLDERLGYVHVDDNEGQTDAHYGLLEGVLDERTLHEFLDALEDSAYDGPLSIEIKADLPSPLLSLTSSRRVISDWAAAAP